MTKVNYASLSTATQRQQAKAEQVKNNAGGFVFKLNPIQQLERFLILGSDSPTYYQAAQELSYENGMVVRACWDRYPEGTIELILDVLKNNRALKQDAPIFALAIGTLNQDVHTRKMVYDAVPHVLKTASSLFMFLDFCQRLNKGWGRGLKNAVGAWYLNKEPNQLGYQVVKYRQRNGFTHKRGLQLSHPRNGEKAFGDIYNWILSKDYDVDKLPDFIKMFNDVNENENAFYDSLPWEAYPTDRIPWTRLAPKMPYTALIRNLNKFDFKPLGDLEQMIVERLENETPSMHPFNIFWGWKTYSSGRGFRGSRTWNVNRRIADALEGAFYRGFKSSADMPERILIGLDYSGSMYMPMSTIKDSNIYAGEAANVMCLSVLKKAKRAYVFGFSEQFVPLDISANMTLNQAIAVTNGKWRRGATDCALPMVHALENKIEVDKFIVFTDNETWVGNVHPYQALENYRKKMGINAKLIVCAMTSTGFSIANPADAGMLDIVGCDSNLPTLIGSF